MGMHLMDTYLICVMAVLEICEGNFEVRDDNLVNELHRMIITMNS